MGTALGERAKDVPQWAALAVSAPLIAAAGLLIGAAYLYAVVIGVRDLLGSPSSSRPSAGTGSRAS